MNIEYTRKALKYLRRLDKGTARYIAEHIEGLRTRPPKGDTTTLKGTDTVMHRLRAGNWRIVFSYVDFNTVLIERIGPRGDVYKGVKL